ncbi:extradiol dioxygenase [Bacillus sp. FJAT-27264]|uniref:VOC family protein n=1 Tax=Paenibacillus sp. (strain DSM 101736 / FJAT-27264) TaxID=1850362 RepID=UPI000807FB17|nr:VOC family protein [Bacillus sp. FJAT-27264]OBZ14904.1 extradiol dioxygenase [Bacillus sp. FJAT-27264]
MTKELWINLPVKNLQKSREFFGKLGFSFHPRHENSDEAAGLIVGDKNVMVMLFPEDTFKSFTGHELADTQQGTEVLLSIDAESREEVDELVSKVLAAGGTVYKKPGGEGWMYGAGFADPDGHRWNVLYMDMSQMPQG